MADHLGLEPGMLWVRVPPGPLQKQSPRGAAWSARHPVKVEIVGSNPIGDASTPWPGTQTEKRRSSNLRDCLWVRLPPVLLTTTCVGWASACPSGCNPPAFGLWRFNSVPTHSMELWIDDFGLRIGKVVELESAIDNPKSAIPMARSSNGRMRDPHSRGMGSIPIRVTQQHGQVAER